MTYPLIMEKLKEVHLENQVKFTSSWDYLIEATKDNEIVTVLPHPVEKYFDKNLYSIKNLTIIFLSTFIYVDQLRIDITRLKNLYIMM